MICTIGRHSPDVIYDPDRLLYPLRRVGPKGTYDFERISWDTAFDTIVERLQDIKAESGPEATAIYTGRGSFDMAMCDLLQPDDAEVSSASSVLFPFGSPNTLGVGALCYVSFAMIAPHVTMGEMYITMDVDVEQSELIVVWGTNPATDSPPLLHQQILKAKRRGAEVVVIDPRRNGTARAAGAQWIPIRPGTDGALALGLINVLVEEELYDEAFVRDWSLGFDELATLVQHYRPEVVEGITGVKRDTIRTLARRIASARGACPVMYTGLEYSDSGVQAIRAVFSLWALAGQLDVPGGLLFRMKENVFPQNRNGLLSNPDMKKALGRDRFPVYSMYRGESHAVSLPDSVLNSDPYKIRALIILGGSIITAWPNPSLWKKTLSELDFLVSINRYHTADSAYADIVLPATTGYEITSYMRYGPLFKIREKMIEPVGEARSDFLIQSELAARLGYGHLFPQTEDDILRQALEGSGFSLEEVRKAGGAVQIDSVMMEYKKWEKGRLRHDGRPGFDTPSGKFEFASSILQEHGYDPLPVYTEPAEGPLSRPDLAKRFPLVFNSGSRTAYDFRSQHHGVSSLSRKLKEPNVLLNSSDADERGIENGDWVWVRTPRGRMKFRAVVTDDIVKGAIDATMGGGGPLGSEAWQECNVNELTDLEHCDPISGFPIYKTLLCQVEKVQGSEDDRQSVSAASLDGSGQDPMEASVQASSRQVYLDHNATTRLDEQVLDAMLPFLRGNYGNPSSIHSLGGDAKTAVEDARRKVASALNCTARRIIFTGGGSEAINLGIRSLAEAATNGRTHIITSAIEHPAVLKTCKTLEKRGMQITVLPVDASGRVDPEDFKKALRDDTLLACIMLANNEVGTIQPIKELVDLAHDNGTLFFCDAVQGLGKIPVDTAELGLDLLSVSAHKLHGPKGVGALYVRRGIDIDPQISGGGQEHGLRSGTENVPGIVGFGKACDLAVQRLVNKEIQNISVLRDRLEAGILRLVPQASVNGDVGNRVPNTTNLTLPGIRGEALLLQMDRRGVYFSSASACKSGNPDPSHVLKAMGLEDKAAHCSVRFSLGVHSTQEDVDYCIEVVDEILQDTMNAIRFVSCR
jgi:cysteine desulfurase NifS